MNLLCRIGLHHPQWQPALTPQPHEWLRIRTCSRCGRPLPKR